MTGAWDIRPSVRRLRRDLTFAVVSIATVGLGVGLSTAVRTVADTVLRKGLPVRDQDRLVVMFGATRDGRVPNYPVSLSDAALLVRQARSLEAVSFFAYQGASPSAIRDGDHVSQLRRSLVSGNFFEVLGVQPVLGRSLTDADDELGAVRAVLLSHRTWVQRYGADTAVLGRTFHTYEDNAAHTIVGVMPEGLDFPRGTDFWTPVRASTSAANLSFVGLDAIGRLRVRATLVDARDDMGTFFARDGSPAWQRDLVGRAESLLRFHLGDVRPAVLAFSGAVALLFLVTCVNVGTLFLVRGASRAREVATRMALGAGRVRAMSPMLVEGLLVATAGLALGLVVAVGALSAISRIAPVPLEAFRTMSLDVTALITGIGITMIATVFFAVLPAWVTTRPDPHVVLMSTARAATGRSRMLPDVLAASQVAIAVAVVSAAGVIARSLIHLERADLAFDPSRLVVVELTTRADRYSTPASRLVLMEGLTSAVASVPGVIAVSPVVAVPFSGAAGWDGRPATESQTVPEASTNPTLNLEVVAPTYFRALGLDVAQGRVFTDDDRETAPLVAVVSRSASRAYWPGIADPIGRGLRFGAQGEFDYTVIGVVPDSRYRDLREARPTMYVPMRQNFAPFLPTRMLIRTAVPVAAVLPALRTAIADGAPGVALLAATPFESLLDGPLAQPRMNALVLVAFALAAAGLAALGVYAVTASGVRRRLRELGIRITVGATGRSIERLVIGRVLGIAVAGGLAGTLLAIASSAATSALVYGVSPADPGTIAGAAASMVLFSLFAALAPARFAARIDPVAVLAAQE